MERLRGNLEYEVPRGYLHLRKGYRGRGALKSCIFTGLLEDYKSGKGHLGGDSKFGGGVAEKIRLWGSLI